MRLAEKKKEKKTHWTREGAVLGYHWTREGALHARHTAKHTLNTRGCSFEYQWTREGATRLTQMYKSTCTHWKDVIHSTRTISGPLFLENAIEIRYRFAFLSCSVCFLISQPRLFGPKTEHKSFFRSQISCMRLKNLRETKKASRKENKLRQNINFQIYKEIENLQNRLFAYNFPSL